MVGAPAERLDLPDPANQLGARVRRYGSAVLPFVLIVLGVSILFHALPLLR